MSISSLVEIVETACEAHGFCRVSRPEVLLHVNVNVNVLSDEKGTVRALPVSLGLVLVKGLLIGHGRLAERADLERKHKQ